ncbi:MAG TPA: cytochrome P450 [Nevskiaceae bacterium]|nr:cytochrome P450 [Nevskiaceae bacterium]
MPGDGAFGLPIPGPKGLDAVRATLALVADPLRCLEDMARTYGRIHTLHVGFTRTVFLHDADLIEAMLRDHGTYLKSAPAMEAVRPLLGTGVASVVDPEEWTRQRHHVLPLFTPKMLRKYYDAMVASVGHELARLERIADDGRAIDLAEFLHQATFRVLVSTIFSRGITEAEIPDIVRWFDEQTVYTSARYLTNSSPLIHAIPGVGRGRRALVHLDALVDRLIDQRLAEGRTDADDMLDALILAQPKDGVKFSRTTVRDNVMTMLFGGHETTAGSVSWAFALLSRNPATYARLREEADRVCGGDAPSIEQFQALTYAGHVFEEAMRLYPMFPFLGREPLHDTTLGGYAIPAHMPIAFVAWTAHRDARHWPDPERFDPDRHAEEAVRARPKCSYLPFSFGQRKCIGERVARFEGMLLLALIARRFDIRLATPGGALPAPKVSQSIKPRGGMPVTIARRAG